MSAGRYAARHRVHRHELDGPGARARAAHDRPRRPARAARCGWSRSPAATRPAPSAPRGFSASSPTPPLGGGRRGPARATSWPTSARTSCTASRASPRCEAGKSVLCEKPLGANLADSEAMLAAAAARPTGPPPAASTTASCRPSGWPASWCSGASSATCAASARPTCRTGPAPRPCAGSGASPATGRSTARSATTRTSSTCSATWPASRAAIYAQSATFFADRRDRGRLLGHGHARRRRPGHAAGLAGGDRLEGQARDRAERLEGLAVVGHGGPEPAPRGPRPRPGRRALRLPRRAGHRARAPVPGPVVGAGPRARLGAHLHPPVAGVPRGGHRRRARAARPGELRRRRAGRPHLHGDPGIGPHRPAADPGGAA